MLKRFLILLSALLLALSPAMAQESSLILSATVETARTVALKAPASGELAPFTVREGDRLSADETVFVSLKKQVFSDIM